MTHWAKEFRLSDVALHKTCRKHDIPTPPPGWWAKQAAGKKVSRTPLPNLKEGTAANLTIASGNLRGETAKLSAVREEARMSLSGFETSAQSIPDPIVAKSFARLRKVKPADNGLLKIARKGTVALELSPESLERAEMCLNQIAEAALVLGFELLKDGDQVVFSNGTTLLPFSVKETVKRVPHVLTPQEIPEDEERERRNARRWSNNDWELYLHDPRLSSLANVR